MLHKPRLQMITVLAVGALLGHLAAAGRWRTSQDASAAPPRPESVSRQGTLVTTETAGPTCCRAGAEKTELLVAASTRALPTASTTAQESGKKPNILVIFGDDIGITNLSCYSDGLMGYETPNIDRIAKEGIRFLHYYGEQSCTAGRSAFLTGQHIIRTGLSKVGFPGAPMGMNQLDPSVGGLLKSLGYATGQFGKNHVGDRNPTLPTVNGFDEFFGNLYHLNAEEEPELPDYPKDPAYRAKFGPRGVLDCKATDVDDPTDDPRFGRVGKQTIKDTGALTKKRMETIDDETSDRAVDFMKRQKAADKPFFCWMNTTRMHLRTHVRAEHRGRYTHGDSEYVDGMIEHDETIGKLLKALDDMGIANDTIIVYTSDNGPHMNTWPDGAMTHFRSEKNTNWEGAFRVPMLVRWPGRIKAGSVTNELMSHNDWIPTFCAIAGEPDIVGKCLKGYDDHHATPTRCTWTGTTSRSSSPPSRGQPTRTTASRAPATRSSTPTTMACSWPCDKGITNMSSRSSALQARCRSGPSHSRRCVSRRSTIFSRTPSSARTLRPTRSGTGRSTTWGRCMARWTTFSHSRRRSRNSRRGRIRQASTPPTLWRR
jgi:arylsulfatase